MGSLHFPGIERGFNCHSNVLQQYDKHRALTVILSPLQAMYLQINASLLLIKHVKPKNQLWRGLVSPYVQSCFNWLTCFVSSSLAFCIPWHLSTIDHTFHWEIKWSEPVSTLCLTLSTVSKREFLWYSKDFLLISSSALSNSLKLELFYLCGSHSGLNHNVYKHTYTLGQPTYYATLFLSR